MLKATTISLPSTSLLAKLNAPIDTALLAMFRFTLGAMVAVSAFRFLIYGWVRDFFVEPTFFFKHWGFSWVPVPGDTAVHALFAFILVAGVMFAIGLGTRVCAVFLFVAFSWVQLMDATNYLNHYYLVSLLLFLCIWLPVGRVHAVDVLLRPQRRLRAIPSWTLWLLRFQVGCVYVFAGKAKLGADWLLHAQPLQIWLQSRADMPVVGWLFSGQLVPLHTMAYAFSWAGFLFDSTIVIWLLWRRTRPYAFVVVVVFHALTMALFPIGMFPVIMVCAATVFFDASMPRRFLGRFLEPADLSTTPTALTSWQLGVVVAWCACHVLLPLRMHLYGGDVLWHEQGMRFAWKVMVREKNAIVTYYVEDKSTGRRRYVRPREWLDARQEREFSTQPDMIVQLAHAIGDAEHKKGKDVRVFAEVKVSLNGRPAALLLDPDVDLMTIVDGVMKASWIRPAPTVQPPTLGRVTGRR